MLNTLVFIFGSMIGSFLNVVIYRLPLGISIVFPRSSCTNCKKLIPWYANIPLLSYVVLRGKCGNCKAKISIRYFVIELLTGLMALYLFRDAYSMDTFIRFIVYFTVGSVFICHFFIDLEHKILPNSLNIYLAITLLLYSIWYNPWQFWLIGAVIGFAVPALVRYAFLIFTGKDGLGMGDIKLYGILGIILGPIGIFHNLFLSCTLGSIFSLVLIGLKIIKRTDYIAFGPFIIIAASFQLFFENIYRNLPILFP